MDNIYNSINRQFLTTISYTHTTEYVLEHILKELNVTKLEEITKGILDAIERNAIFKVDNSINIYYINLNELPTASSDPLIGAKRVNDIVRRLSYFRKYDNIHFILSNVTYQTFKPNLGISTGVLYGSDLVINIKKDNNSTILDIVKSRIEILDNIRSINFTEYIRDTKIDSIVT